MDPAFYRAVGEDIPSCHHINITKRDRFFYAITGKDLILACGARGYDVRLPITA
jgi:hypothetical protein